MLARSRVALLFVGVLLLLFPFTSYAEGTAADAICFEPGMCQYGTFCDPPKNTIKGVLNKPCKDLTSGFTTMGKCVTPFKCEATGTSDGKLDQGMAKLGEMLGKLMEMMKPKDGGGGGSGSPSPTGEGCITMQPTGDKALAGGNAACYYYQESLDTGVDAVDPSGGLVAIPTEGAAPVSIQFAFTNGSSGCGTPALYIEFGDGEIHQAQIHAGGSCTGISETVEHTYTTAGQYAARLKNAATDEVRGGVNITISEGSDPVPTTPTSTTTGNANTGGTNNTSTGNESNIGVTSFTTPLTNLFTNGTLTGGTNSNPTTSGSASTGGSNFTNPGASLNFDTPQSIVQSIVAKNLPPGSYGDVKILSNGTTIVAGVREQNTEVAGFYGTNTATGQGQGAVARMCTSRPWASNFLSYIIPPTFFDSLCSLRGYSVGPSQQVVTTPSIPSTPKTPVPKTPAGTAKGAAGTATTSATAPSTAKVDIWASPATVPLGARTSIFWNTQGVTDCIETSPDGSFTHATLKGGASTVPLTTATTFTISCIAENGAPITDYVTVQMAL